MNLKITIDVGNTLVKIAAFSDNQCLKTGRNLELTAAFLDDFIQDFSEKMPKAILSSVRRITPEMLQLLNERFRLTILNAETPIPITNLYTTPQTLGSDRLAAVIGAAKIFDRENVLIFDLGSCITWDFIDCQKKYMGGGIAPGIKMRLQAVHTFTEKLPLIEVEFAADLLGKSTANSIKAGCVNAVALEINALIDHFKEQFCTLKVILCGGDAEMLQKKIKNNTFVHPDLVQIGLKEILDFDEDK